MTATQHVGSTRTKLHTCPSCTPAVFADRDPICPRCGRDIPDAEHDNKWAIDVCDDCKNDMGLDDPPIPVDTTGDDDL